MGVMYVALVIAAAVRGDADTETVYISGGVKLTSEAIPDNQVKALDFSDGHCTISDIGPMDSYNQIRRQGHAAISQHFNDKLAMCYIGGSTSDSTTGGEALDNFICSYSTGGPHHPLAQPIGSSFHGFLTAAVAVDHPNDITYIVGGHQISNVGTVALWYGNLLSGDPLKSVPTTLNAVAGHGLALMYPSGAPTLYVIGGYTAALIGQHKIYTTISVLHPNDATSPLAVAKDISLRPAYGDAGVWGAGVATSGSFVFIAGGCVGPFKETCLCSRIVARLDAATETVMKMPNELATDRCEPRLVITQSAYLWVIGGRDKESTKVISTAEGIPFAGTNDESASWTQTAPCQYTGPSSGTLDVVRFGVSVSQPPYITTVTGTTTVSGTTTVTDTTTITGTTTITDATTTPTAKTNTAAPPTVTRAYMPATHTSKKWFDNGYVIVGITILAFILIFVVVYCAQPNPTQAVQKTQGVPEEQAYLANYM